MGLAASQARFLAITARKMNCEFQSMQIAQEKLSTTRDLQRAANEYQNSLNATKLVWDSDNETYNLSYDVMTRPTTLNNFTPYLLTDTKGKVVLSNEMFNAARDAGIIDADGNPTFGKQFVYTDGSYKNNNEYKPFKGEDYAEADGSRNAFLYSLAKYNQIDGTIIDGIIGKGDAGYTRSGIGGAIFDKSMANVLNPVEYREYMKKAVDENGNNPYNVYSMLTNLFGEGYNAQSSVVNSTGLSDGKFTVTKSGKALSETELKNLTLGDILLGDYKIAYNGSGGIDKITDVLKGIAKIFGYEDVNHITGLNVDTESNQALSLAYDYTKALFGDSNKMISGNESAVFSDPGTHNRTASRDNLYVASLTNMTKAYLTNFARALDGLSTSYYVDKDLVSKSSYVTGDVGYSFITKNDGAMTDQIDLNADFYNMLYNVISTTGACTDEQLRNMVKDDAQLQEAVKNGRMFVSYLNTDGYFYQGAYSLTEKIAEVTDEDAIARAEREYEVTKSRLNTKEETLELKMKNLDMEISALTTEFDTVKNMISKSVEKVFTMFNN